MKRLEVEPRDKWQEHLLYELEFGYHTMVDETSEEDVAYWNEDAFYEFTSAEVDEIEKATDTCYGHYIDMVGDLIENKKLDLLQIPKWAHGLIERSWERDDRSMIGRMDFSLNNGKLKMFEFNGDTPTSLLEASIVQWDAKVARYGEDKTKADQFNSIHESMIEAWKWLRTEQKITECHFISFASREDISNAVYAMKLAQEAGIKTGYLSIDEVGVDLKRGEFYGVGNESIKYLYKLWPWEYMLNEDARAVLATEKNSRVIEPIWKLAMSTKAALPLLHEYFPDSPYILKSFFTEEEAKKNLGDTYVKKPIISREGGNVTMVENGKVICQETGDFGKEGFIYQEMAKLPDFIDSRDQFTYNPVIGSWLIGGEAKGMGIRESNGLITNNTSFFTPHIFR
jgi:glutathionylspermidine synthase